MVIHVSEFSHDAETLRLRLDDAIVARIERPVDQLLARLYTPYIHSFSAGKQDNRLTLEEARAQYTPPTPTRLNCRVELRRRCVHNSQLATIWTSLNSEVELRRVSGVNAPVGSRDPIFNSRAVGDDDIMTSLLKKL